MVPDNETGLLDAADGRHEDWLELVNCGGERVSLAGLTLTKDLHDPGGDWPLPAIDLEPGERIIIFCDKDPEQGVLHADFRLDRDGDQVLIVRPAPVRTLVDSLTFGSVPDDLAFGRPECGAAARLLGPATPLAENAVAVEFRRGDANADGLVNISDPVTILSFLFLGEAHLVTCHGSADTDDSGSINITDAIALLGHLFLGGRPLPEPAENCDVDPTPDELGCDAFAPCW